MKLVELQLCKTAMMRKNIGKRKILHTPGDCVQNQQPKVLFPCSFLLQSVMTDKVEDQEGLIKNHLAGVKVGFLLPWHLEFSSSDFFNVKCRNYPTARLALSGLPHSGLSPLYYTAKVVPFVSPSWCT